ICLIIKHFGSSDVYLNDDVDVLKENIKSKSNWPEIEIIGDDLCDRELVQLYSTCDLLVHPFQGEGFGLPILEAIACELPVLVTEGGAPKDFVSENDGALIKSST
ncbi:MAG: glycosyltransferase, partial [Fidelibacterota bacterium]